MFQLLILIACIGKISKLTTVQDTILMEIFLQNLLHMLALAIIKTHLNITLSQVSGQ